MAVPFPLLLLAWSRDARAVGPERPLLPAYGIAGDDGAASLWRNPANLAFDPDPGYALIYRQELVGSGAPAFSASGNTGPLGMGVQYSVGADGTPWWTLASGFGLKLDRDLSLGVNVGWQLPSGEDNNLTTWDVGVGYRPLPWLGVAGIMQNIGSPAPERGVAQHYGVGVAIRPLGERAMLNVDYLLTDQEVTSSGGVASASLRIKPVRGLVLRAYGDSDRSFGGGLEVYFGGAGVGAHGLVDGGGTSPATALAYLVSGDPEERLFGRDRTVAHFRLEQDFPYQPAGGFLGQGASESYLHLLGRLKEAAHDPHTRGLVLHLDQMPFNFAQVEEVRAVIAEARANGKPVIAYLDRSTSNGAYLLACAADKIYLHPAGQLDLIGLSFELQYFRGSFDLLGVKPQFARRAEYKAAVSSYTATGSSGPEQEQMNALIDDLYTELVEGIARGRGKTPEAIRALIDQGPFSPEEALKAGLIDGQLYPDELEEGLAELGDRYLLDDEYALGDSTSGWRSPYEVAVVYVDGAIVSGGSASPGLLNGQTAGSDTIVGQLEQAMEDASVKAVVLRVDSPGGSAFASDEIWRAVDRLTQEKPLVVSMGGVAASGGYYVSAGASRIFAEPNTITGSIGVFSGKFSLEGLYEKVGLNYEIYNRGRNASMNSLSKPFDAEEYATLDRQVGPTYEQFKSRVGEGRQLTPEKVEQVARGRVWSGRDALDQGLVDELGGFDDALASARALADIPARADVELITYEPLPGTDRFARGMVRGMLRETGWFGASELPPLPDVFQDLGTWTLLAQDPVLAMMPYNLDVR